MRRYELDGILVITACFLLPFPTIGVWGAPISASDILLLLAGILAVTLRGFTPSISVKQSLFYVITWLFFCILIPAGIILSDMVVGNTVYNTLRITGQYLWAYLGIPLILLTQSPQTLLRALFALMLGVLLSTVIGIGLVIVAPHIYHAALPSGIFPIEDRVGAFLGPNAQAKLIATLIPFALVQIALKTRPRGVWSAWLLIAGMGLVGSASFGGLISTIVALIGTLALLYKYFSRIIFHLLIVSLFAYSTLMFSYPLWRSSNLEAALNRLTRPLDRGEVEALPSYQIRAMLIEEAWNRVQQSPLIGLGSGRYQSYSAFGIPVHNTYLLLWSEGGLLSLLGIVGFGVIPIIFALSKKFLIKKNSMRRVLIPIMSLSILLFLLNISSNTYSFSRYTVVPVALQIVLVFKLCSINEMDMGWSRSNVRPESLIRHNRIRTRRC